SRHIRSQPAFTPFYALNERDRARLMYLTDIDLPSDLNLPAGVAVEVHLP
nr:hemolysin D [Shewanella shenzhenensis]